MNLFLMRHGYTDPLATGEKRLSQLGKQQIAATANFLRKYPISFDYIITSTLQLAKQTGQVLQNTLKKNGSIFEDSTLNPGSFLEDIIILANSLDAENILFVGHEPDMSHHTSFLVAQGPANFKFSPGSIAKIHFNNSVKVKTGILEMLIPPLKQ